MYESLLSSPSAIAAPLAGIRERDSQDSWDSPLAEKLGRREARYVLLLQLDDPQATFLLHVPAFAAQLTQGVDVPVHSMGLAGSHIRGFN